MTYALLERTIGTCLEVSMPKELLNLKIQWSLLTQSLHFGSYTPLSGNAKEKKNDTYYATVRLTWTASFQKSKPNKKGASKAIS